MVTHNFTRRNLRRGTERVLQLGRIELDSPTHKLNIRMIGEKLRKICKLFIVSVVILLFSACQPLGTASPSPTPEVPQGTETAILQPSKETDISEAMTAQEAVETYYVFMSAQKYSEAYQLLSPLRPHLNAIEEFVSRAEELYKSYELGSVESLPIWVSTTFANEPTRNKTVVENDRCKRFAVEVKVEYKQGQVGAGPSGTYSYALTVIKDEDGWKIVQIDTIPDPQVCERYK